MKRQGIVVVTHEAMAKLLGLPSDMQIQAIMPIDIKDVAKNQFRVLVQGESERLYIVPEGTEVPFISLPLLKEESE